MRLEEALSSHLQTKLNSRMYPFLLPQKCDFPAIVYFPVSVERLHALIEDTGFVKQRIQFTCHAKSYKESVETASIIKNELQNFHGVMSELTIGSVLIINETSDFEPKTQIYSVILEFEFQFEEG